eukprot:PhF_6_TR37441/c0_g1_i1/m.55018/K20196/KIF3B; kinesin family member 3B
MSKAKKGGAKDSENIRVVVRVRPLLGDEKERSEKEAVRLDLSNNQIIVSHPGGYGDPDRWTFDAVYNNTFSQRDVYRQEVAPLIDAVMNGYNATVFAYGQSGSGKTHTMTGKIHDPQLQGMMPQAVEHIFKEVKEQTSSTKSFKVKVSYLELYNGNARDLLQKKQVTLEIKENSSKNFYVKGAELIEVVSAADCVRLFNEGTERRTTASTSLNDESSRSHSLFILTIEQYDFEQDPTAPVVMTSKMNLVDLAGSERQTKTGAAGETLKEGCNINLSLSALASVIDTIVKGGKHIPYRSSPLTKLLKDSLGGNSKTVMFANCGPSERNVSETISTLRFAERAKQIENKPVKNMDPKDAKIAELLSKIEQLQEKLGKGGNALEEEENLRERIEQLEFENQQLRGSQEKDTIDLEEQLKEKESVIHKLASMVEESNKQVKSAMEEKQLQDNKLQVEVDTINQLKQLIGNFMKKVCTTAQLQELAKSIPDHDDVAAPISEIGNSWEVKDLEALLHAYSVALPKWKGASVSREEVDREINKARQAAEAELKSKIDNLERERNELQAMREQETKNRLQDNENNATINAELAKLREENVSLVEKIKRDQDKFRTKLDRMKTEATQQRDELDAQLTALKKDVEQKDSALNELQRTASSSAAVEAERNQTAEVKRELTARLQESEMKAQSLQAMLTEMEVVLKKKGIRVKTQSGQPFGQGTAAHHAGGDDGQHPDPPKTAPAAPGQQPSPLDGSTPGSAVSNSTMNDGMMIINDDEDEIVRHIQQQVRLQHKLFELRHAQQKKLDSMLLRYQELSKERASNVSEEMLQAQIKEALAAKDKELEEAKADAARTQDKLVKKINKKLQEFTDEKTTLEEENVELKETNGKNVALINQLQLDLQMAKNALEKRNIEIESETRLKESEVNHLRKEVENFKGQLDVAKKELEQGEAMKEEFGRMQEQLGRMEASLKEKIISLDNNRQMLKWSNSLLDQEKKRVLDLETKLKGEERKLAEAEEHFREDMIENSNKLVQINNRRLDEQAAQFERQLHEEGEKQKAIREKLKKAKAQTQKAKQKYDELVLENEVLQMHLEESKVAVLKMLRQQQQSSSGGDAFGLGRPGSAYKRV